jgi:hypothetical protein
LAKALAIIAVGLEEGEIAHAMWDQATQSLLWVLQDEQNGSTFEDFAKRLETIALRLEGRKAIRLLCTLAKLTLILQNQYRPWHKLFDLTLTLVERLRSGEATQILAQIPFSLEKVEKSPGDWLCKLASRVIELEKRLRPREAMQISVQTINEMIMAARATTGLERFNLEAGIVTLVQALDPELVADYSRTLAVSLCSARDANDVGSVPMNLTPARYDRTDNLDALLANNTQKELSRRTAEVSTAVGMAGHQALSLLPLLSTMSKASPYYLSTQELIDLLKMPTCFGKARQVVLKHLGNRYHRVFANHWDFVRYAKEQRLDLDFTTPPKRPARP